MKTPYESITPPPPQIIIVTDVELVAKGICALLNKKEEEVCFLAWDKFFVTDYAFTGIRKYILHIQEKSTGKWKKAQVIIKNHPEIRWVVLGTKAPCNDKKKERPYFFVSLNEHNEILEKNLCIALNELSGDERQLVLDATRQLQYLRKKIFTCVHDDLEIEIFNMLHEGKPETKIAYDLNLSLRNYQRKQKTLADKIDVKNKRVFLVKYAVENGIIDINKNDGDVPPFGFI